MPREGRQEDPRQLSREHPGRSSIQDNPPSLTPTEAGRQKVEEDKTRFVATPSPTQEDLERREARGTSSMPYGRKGSRRGKPLGDR